MANYVRFQRGTQEAYNNLKSLNRLNDSTLYFIYDKDNISVGSLYMGSRLISGGEATVITSSLKDLTDVIVNQSGENYFLVQDRNGKWVSTSLNQVSALIESKLSKPDLSNFATKQELKKLEDQIATLDELLQNLDKELDNKVDKVIYKVPVLDAEGNPTYDENGQEIFKEVEGTLVTPEDREKLNALVLDEGGVEISGTVNAENVEGLGTWITTHGGTYIKNLTEDNLDVSLADKINFINSVETEHLVVVDSKLDLHQDIIDNIQAAFNGEFNFIKAVNNSVFSVNDGRLDLIAVPTGALTPVLGDLSTLPNVDKNFTLVDEIHNLYDILTWTDIEN